MSLSSAPKKNPQASPPARPRISFGFIKCTVYSYPTQGGIITAAFSDPELSFLGLSRTATDPGVSSDPDTEDAFGLRMLQLGARWWPSLKFQQRHFTYGSIPYGYHYPPDLQVSYPSTGSGVWVLAVWAGNWEKWDPPRRPENWSKLRLCGNMDERCEVLKEFGATFYERVDEYDKLPETMEEGVREGKRYEGLLKRMEDRKCVEDRMKGL